MNAVGSGTADGLPPTAELLGDRVARSPPLLKSVELTPPAPNGPLGIGEPDETNPLD